MNESFDPKYKLIDVPDADFTGFESDEYRVLAGHLAIADQFLQIFVIVRKHDDFSSDVYNHCDENPKFGQLRRA